MEVITRLQTKGTQNRLSGAHICIIVIYFAEKDGNLPVTVQIREVTTGLPNNNVLAEQVIAPQNISLEDVTKVNFPNPIHLQAGSSYAVLILTQ